jgi:hypothetical protein
MQGPNSRFDVLHKVEQLTAIVTAKYWSINKKCFHMSGNYFSSEWHNITKKDAGRTKHIGAQHAARGFGTPDTYRVYLAFHAPELDTFWHGRLTTSYRNLFTVIHSWSQNPATLPSVKLQII